ncbi:hypothetical protein ACLB2K_045452 [Fragaria x ananassa]
MGGLGSLLRSHLVVTESSAELTTCLKQYLAEDQIFRIDHYWGKELVENLSVLCFSNLDFEPVWSRS